MFKKMFLILAMSVVAILSTSAQTIKSDVEDAQTGEKVALEVGEGSDDYVYILKKRKKGLNNKYIFDPLVEVDKTLGDYLSDGYFVKKVIKRSTLERRREIFDKIFDKIVDIALDVAKDFITELIAKDKEGNSNGESQTEA